MKSLRSRRRGQEFLKLNDDDGCARHGTAVMNIRIPHSSHIRRRVGAKTPMSWLTKFISGRAAQIGAFWKTSTLHAACKVRFFSCPS